MHPPSAQEILAALRQVPLLAADQLVQVEEAIRGGKLSAERLTKWLRGVGGLTEFQIDAICGGRAARLSFGPYVLLDKLGEGGMGVVYKARHRRLGRIDAVKVMRADKIASKIIAKRFLREIRLTSGLDHPHIVRAYDAGEVGRQLYLATEYIAGQDLQAAVAQHGPLSVAEACLVIYQTALALDHVHAMGLVHRDLKPSNLLRSDLTHAVKLLDLGLSGVYSPEPGSSLAGSLTREGVLLGTPDFMSPEQIRDPHGVDIRADLYSLGCTFYFLLTGRPPFEGAAVDKLQQHCTAPLPPIVLSSGFAPPALSAVINKLTAKHPEERYQIPNELIAALVALRTQQTAEPGSAHYPTGEMTPNAATDHEPWRSQFDELMSRESLAELPPPKPKRAPSRGPKWWWIGSAAAAVLVVVVVAVVLSRHPGTTLVVEKPSIPQSTDDSVTEEFRALRKAVLESGGDREALRRKVIEFRGKHAGRPLAVTAANLLRRLPSPLDRLMTETDSESGLSVTMLPRSSNGRVPVIWLGFSPADDKLFVIREGMAPEEWDVVSLQVASRYGTGDAAQGSASLTPDGRIGVGVVSGGVLSIGFASGRTRSLDLGASHAVRVASVTPDGKSVVAAFVDGEQQLARVDLDTSKFAVRLDQRSLGVNAIVVSPDSATCLIGGEDGAMRLFSLSTGQQLQTFDPVDENRLVATYGPDGQHVYMVGSNPVAARFALGGRCDVEFPIDDMIKRRMNFWSRSSIPTSVAVSADEYSLAIGGPGGDVKLFAPSTGKSLQQFSVKGRVRVMAFSTNGRVLAVGLENGRVDLVLLKG